MAQPASVRMALTSGDLGLAIVFAALAPGSLVVAGKAWTTACSFFAFSRNVLIATSFYVVPDALPRGQTPSTTAVAGEAVPA